MDQGGRPGPAVGTDRSVWLGRRRTHLRHQQGQSPDLRGGQGVYQQEYPDRGEYQTFEVDRVFTSKSTQIEVSTNKARVQTFEVDRVFTSKSTQIEVSTNKARVHPDRGEYQ